jgi:hypothetical protein
MKVGDTMRNNLKHDIKEVVKDTSPDILESIKNSPRFKVPQKESKDSILSIFSPRSYRMAFGSLLMLVILITVFVLSPAEQTYAATITLDINPQIEISLDDDDNVIDINALNEDGETIVSQIGRYKRQSIDSVLGNMVKALESEGYLIDDTNYMIVSVECDNQEIKERIQSMVEQQIETEANHYQRQMHFIRDTYESNDEDQDIINQLAIEYNVSPPRMNLMYAIVALDDSYSYEDLAQLTPRSLYDIYQDLVE